MAQLVASVSGVVQGGVAEVVGSNLARGKIFTASISMYICNFKKSRSKVNVICFEQCNICDPSREKGRVGCHIVKFTFSAF